MIVSQFGSGLNTQDTPAELDPAAAQDLLNVNIQPGGASIFKRDGYGLDSSLTYSTSPTHGLYHFQQTSGSDVRLVGSDLGLYASVNDAAFVRVATGTLAATWQCADSQGSAYCLSSSRDMAVKTDGTSANTSYQNGVPLGTMLTFTPTQLVVAGVSGNESTIYVSQQNAFTSFTIGTLPSSPFTEPVASPGSRITHIAYYFGKLFWWKDQSFGYATFTNQNDWQLTIVSNQIGTLDNSDAFWNSSGFDTGAKFSGTASANAEKSPGGIFFRGQDNHFYVYDGYYLTRLSRVITPTVTAASRKKANSWTQTNQADFSGGSATPAVNISTTVSVGDVTVSSYSVFESTASGFSSGNSTYTTLVAGSGMLFNASSFTITNNDFETNSGVGGTPTNWTNSATSAATEQAMAFVNCGSISPKSGSWVLEDFGTTSVREDTATIVDMSGAVISSTTFGNAQTCTWTQKTIVGTNTNNKLIKIQLLTRTGSLTSQPFIGNGNSISLYYVSDYQNILGTNNWEIAIDTFMTTGFSTASYTSQVYDTGFTSSTMQLTAIASGQRNAKFAVWTTTTSANQTWFNTLTSSGTNAVGNRYVKFTSSITYGMSDTSTATLTSLSFVTRSTGTYYSAVNNAANLTSWGTMGINDTTPGASSIAYYVRASTGSFTVGSSTPLWVSQTKNSTVNYSTGTYMQLRADFSLTAATETPAINDFTFNWFEGTAASQAFITYFNDGIWFSVSASSSVSTNNRIFYWDILNGAWLIYDIPSNGFLVENNSLYFGSPTVGQILKFGSVTTDNGAAINSYWRSKSFLGADPFVQNEFVQADFVLGESSTTLTYTYTLDSKTETAYSMTAYDSAASLIQRNFLLPAGKIGKYYDFKIGDNSSNAAWRLMGHRVHYNPLNWKPVTN